MKTGVRLESKLLNEKNFKELTDTQLLAKCQYLL